MVKADVYLLEHSDRQIELLLLWGLVHFRMLLDMTHNLHAFTYP